MPLIHGKSKKAFGDNVSKEMHEGKPQAQALAIAYNTKRKAQKMANGGMAGSHQSPGMGHTINIHVTPQAEYDPTESPGPKGNSMAMHESDKGLNQHGADETGPMGATSEHMGERMVSDPQDEMGDQTDAHEMDMVDRIMAKREMPSRETAGAYSRGGMVANEDSGESASTPHRMAKDEPNEFDDLALRDDLESDYTGANSGDEDGSTLNQTDGEDMVDRIMRKRSKK
jgi:hypothetical protein